MKLKLNSYNTLCCMMIYHFQPILNSKTITIFDKTSQLDNIRIELQWSVYHRKPNN